ncbi:MAG: carbon storage regulator [Deltaproteobacteria bacterium]|nr:carbon storage regulator [Deltaproteobacteria bacterium]
MLILTRKIGEMIRIGDEVTVRVLGVRGGQVSLGFTAPNDVRILREEVVRDERPLPPQEAAAGEEMRGERANAKPPAKLRTSPERRIARRSA